MSIAAIDRPRLGDSRAEAKPSRPAKEWRATLVRDNVSIRDAIRAIDESALQIALIVDADWRLLATIIDGDVGRARLRGTSLDAAATEVMNADIVRKHFADGSRRDVAIDYLGEHQELATTGALGLLPQRLKTPLIVMNGDLLTAVNFSSMLEFHVEHRATRREHKFENPRPSCFVNAGVYQRALDVLCERPQASNDNAAESPAQGCCSDIDRLALLKRSCA